MIKCTVSTQVVVHLYRYDILLHIQLVLVLAIVCLLVIRVLVYQVHEGLFRSHSPAISLRMISKKYGELLLAFAFNKHGDHNQSRTLNSYGTRYQLWGTCCEETMRSVPGTTLSALHRYDTSMIYNYAAIPVPTY